jgi:hypothetical protein
MGDSVHTTHHTNQNQKSAPALFLEYENIFQKRPPWCGAELQQKMYHEALFLKNVIIFEKRGVLMLSKKIINLQTKAQ